MTVTIDLPQELETELSAEAQQLGLQLSEYILRLISTGVVFGKAPKTGAELVNYWKSEGLIGSRPEISDPQEHSRKLRDTNDQNLCMPRKFSCANHERK